MLLTSASTVLTFFKKQDCLSAGNWSHSLTGVYFFKGFKYLYLTPQDYTKISSLNSVHCKHIEEEGESR